MLEIGLLIIVILGLTIVGIITHVLLSIRIGG